MKKFPSIDTSNIIKNGTNSNDTYTATEDCGFICDFRGNTLNVTLNNVQFAHANYSAESVSVVMPMSANDIVTFSRSGGETYCYIFGVKGS